MRETPPVEALLKGDDKVSARQRAALVSNLRRLQMRQMPNDGTAGHIDAACDLCGTSMATDHRHLLQLEERRMVCVCESCWALRSGDAAFRPAGQRRKVLNDFDMPEEVWASFQIPIGLPFFFFSGSVNRVIALYPSPAGATECELDLDAWETLKGRNPALQQLEPDAEALLVNRMGGNSVYALAPIDECYRLVGMIKAAWEGISGGPNVQSAVETFFAELEVKAATRHIRSE